MTTTITKTVEATTTVEHLLPAVENLAKICTKERKNMRIRTNPNNTITLSVDNWEVTAEVTLPATNTTPGEFTVDAPRTSTMLKKAVGTRNKTTNALPVTFVSTDSNVAMTISDITLNLDQETPLEDYGFNLPESSPIGAFPAATIREVWSQVESSCSTDDSLPMLTGVDMKLVGNRCEFRSTDRYRLSTTAVDYTPHVDPQMLENKSILIRGNSLKLLVGQLKTVEGEVTVKFVGNTKPCEGILSFEFGNTVFTAKLLDADFPNIDSLLAKQAETVCVFNRNELVTKLKKLSGVAPRFADLRINIVDGVVGLNIFDKTGRTDDNGNSIPLATTTIDTDVAYKTGRNTLFGVNCNYLVDCLNSFDVEDIALTLMNPGRPILMFDANEYDADGNITVDKEKMIKDATEQLDRLDVCDLPARDHKMILMPIRLPG